MAQRDDKQQRVPEREDAPERSVPPARSVPPERNVPPERGVPSQRKAPPERRSSSPKSASKRQAKESKLEEDPWIDASEEERDPWDTLVPHQQGARYDAELERFLRIAVRAGIERGPDSAVNYTTLLIAFAFCDDAASRFLQRDSLFNRADLLESRGLSTYANNEREFISEALNGALPTSQTMYSSSARRMLDLANEIAGTTSRNSPIGTRHLLAAFLFRSPPDHAADLRKWGLDSQGFATSFPRFIQGNWSKEASAWTEFYRRYGIATGTGGDPTNARDEIGAVEGSDTAQAKGAVEMPLYVDIATFGSDDPARARRDLLDVKDEARAFARIVASRNTRLPLSIGVFGEWGSGKTFFMGLMNEHVKLLSQRAKDEADKSLFLPDIVQISFNAWHYIETNLWASLVEYIFAELDRSLRGNQKPREQVERLFEQLSTSRLLKLEAIENLIVQRRERKAAEGRLAAARRDYEGALLRQSAATSKDFWRAVLDTFKASLGKESARVETLVKDLGLDRLSESAASLNAVLKEAQTERGRAKVLHRAMVAKLAQPLWLAAIAVTLLAVPAGIVLLKDLLVSVTDAGWVRMLNEGVLALSGVIATAVALIGHGVRSARGALAELEVFRDKLDDAVKQRTDDFKNRSGEAAGFAQAEREVARLKNELEQAERKFAEADKRADDVLRDYQSATARGRLNAFIRDKLASGDYAKHLGLIATIRKDFEQLAQLMAEARNDKKSREDYLRVQAEYRARLAALLKLGKEAGALSEEELERLGQEQPAPDPGLFTRIILYIDDLDRCPPDKVVDVLQAIHLLLYFPLFVVVVAVDARWVSRSLREQFPQLLTENIIAPRRKQARGQAAPPDDEKKGQTNVLAADLPTAATSHDYLEKIFQIPYWVRPMDRDASMKYVKGIADVDVVAPGGDVARGDGVMQPVAGDTPPAPGPGGVQQAATPANVAGSAPVQDQSTAQAEVREEQTEEQARYVARSMTFTSEEGRFLEALAPFVGSTPRRGLRFVNIYRLVKTSLPENLQNELLSGKLPGYRALITQLAIVTGAPHASWTYFKLLEQVAVDLRSDRQPKNTARIETLDGLCKRLRADLDAVDGGQASALIGALECLRRLNSDQCIEDGSHILLALDSVAPVARRYSFTARPH